LKGNRSFPKKRKSASPFVQLLGRVKQKRSTTEHDEQVSFISWARAVEGQHPELRLLYAIPNGGFRSIKTAVAMKAEGVRRGIPDIHFPCPKADKGLCGMWIEMKATSTGRLSAAQKEVHENLRAIGYQVVVAYTAIEAIKSICEYMDWDNGFS